MADDRDTSYTAKDQSGFTGTCDNPPWYKFWDLGHGCTGTLPDAGKGFGNVQDVMRGAQDIESVDTANDALDQMGEKMADASEGAGSEAIAAQPSAIQAFNAIAVARTAVASGGPFSVEIGDAAAKTQVYLNQLTAGKVQLDFAKGRLIEDLKRPIEALGIDFDWLIWIAIALGGAIIAWKLLA